MSYLLCTMREEERDLIREMRAWAFAARNLRKQAGLTQQDAVHAARSAGIRLTVGTISGWESGKHHPKLRLFWGYLRCMGFSAEEIFEQWTARNELELQEDQRTRALSVDELIDQLEGDPELRKAIEVKLELMNGNTRAQKRQ